MITVAIIGFGNVSQHLIKAFSKNDTIKIKQVYTRQFKNSVPIIHIGQVVTDLNDLNDADVYIIAVSDDAIQNVSSQLPFANKLVVHTSGAVPITAIDDKNRRGVFYPLQTFTKNKEVDFAEIPICLETEDEKDYTILKTLASSISNSVFTINSQQRKALHIAAVFVNNFTNYMYQIGAEICIENQIPFTILKPLITETANKIKTLTPTEAQTGPAKRNDQNTIQSHLNFLSDENQKNIYKLLTQSILTNGKKL